MHEQKTYHEGNAAECETITRRLHWLSGLCFAGTLVACVLAMWLKDAHWLLLLAAGLPALAAAVHGILATGEYIKLGESSTATAGAIGRLIGDVDARLADGQGRGEPVKSLDAARPRGARVLEPRDQRSDGLAGHAARQERPAAVGGEHD